MKPHILCNPASSKGRSKVNVIDWSREYLHDFVDLTGESAEASALALRQAVAEIKSIFFVGGWRRWTHSSGDTDVGANRYPSFDSPRG